jgi:hypothetical protein
MKKSMGSLLLLVMLRVFWDCLVFSGNGIVIGVTKDGVVARSDDGVIHFIDNTCVNKSKWEDVVAQ